MNSRSYVYLMFIVLVLCANFGVSVQANAQSADKERTAMMRYRHLFMDTKGKHAKAIKLLIKNKLSLRHIVTHAKALAAMSDDMLLLFPAGTTGGKSRAMDHIWGEDGKLSQEFKDKAGEMRKQAEELVRVAQKGNYKKIKKQMGRFANKGCRGCHSDYRGEEFTD